MDAISIRDLRVKAHVGVTEEERASEQLLIVTVEVATDLRRAGSSDDLGDTIDYGRLTEDVAGLVEQSRSALLEHLAEQIASYIAAMPGVNGVTVEIAKDAPPIQQDVGSVSVRIERL
ncbi:MAG TPA: dihydroneopterin aldolase [Actinomycetota bacterium]|nr:dihydroneopterin aldolase [Actinomycetota bacterium]